MVISPAKTLDYETPVTTSKFSIPDYLDKSAELVDEVKKKSSIDLMSMMQVSQKLADINVKRFNQWHLPFNVENSKQAVLAFKGDVYNGINAITLTEDNLNYAQLHLRIISGLYGILRPLDLMQPYRLEMGLKLKTKNGKNLYEFWGMRITNALNSLLAEEDDPVLINLASNEYFNSIHEKNLDCRLITPEFKDWKNDSYKMISFYAKKARGMMVRFAIDHNIKDPNDCKNFDYDGYNYNSELSRGDSWVFSRG